MNCIFVYLNYIRYQPVPGKQRARILVKKNTISQCRRELTRFPLLLISHGIRMLESHICEADEAYFRLFTIKVTKWAELLFRIRQFPGSNVDPETGLSSDFFFFLLLLSFSGGKFRDSALNYVTAASFLNL
jgi:hypothetical protein